MDDLIQRIVSFIAGAPHSEAARRGERQWREDFRNLYLELFRRQCERIPAYAAFCVRRGVDPALVNNLALIPALPQAVYKSGQWLGSEPKGEYAWTFRTSGTTALKRGERPVARMDVYAESCCAGLELFVVREFPELAYNGQPPLPDVGAGFWRIPMFFFKEPADVARESSLTWMFEQWRVRCGARGSAFCWEGGRQGRITLDPLKDYLREHPEQPVLVAGTALHMLEFIERAANPCPLPPGSVVMETGGLKGRRAGTTKAFLYRTLSQYFAVPEDHVANEYGMTEIFSQTYARGTSGGHTAAPWMQVRLINPHTAQPCIEGEPGVIEILDLASVDCVPAVQTEDLGIVRSGKLFVLGRVSAEARGCSLGGGDL